MNQKNAGVLIVVSLAAFVANAIPAWPVQGTWDEVLASGVGYQDLHYDEFSATDNVAGPPNDDSDLVGGTDHHGNTYTTAYTYNDGSDLMFRVRVTGNPDTGGQFTWTAILNTTGDSAADFGLQLDLSSPDKQVELVTALSGGPANNWDIEYQSTPHTGVQESSATAKTDWYRFVNATVDGDGSHFHAVAPDDDYFVDFAIGLADFYAATGLTAGDTFQMAFSTSTSHTLTLKDLPDGGWSDPVVVPEPTALSLLVLGCALLGFRRRKV